MKPFNLSVAVIIMLAFLLIQEGCTISIDNWFVLFTQVADNKRQKRHNGACKFCCNCCGRTHFCAFCCEW
uniref:Hepcidin-like n=1 Tax=Hippocampus comes TaxID=109280 RepID=A0A3Q2XVN7_HIPCM